MCLTFHLYLGIRAVGPSTSKDQGLRVVPSKSKTMIDCQCCTYVAKDTVDLLQHYKTQHMHEQICCSLKCPECATKFPDVHSLLEHNRSCLECKICGKFLSNRYNTLRHMKTFHSNERKFSCKFCGNTFKHKCHLKDHLVTCKFAPK